MKTLRVAVFGCGHLGRIHTRLVRNHAACELVGVYDPLEAARDAVAREFNTTAWRDPLALAQRIDAAIVATPTQFHHAVATDLLGRGVHCLVEKPITSTVEEAQALVTLAGQRDCVLQVGHVERFNPAWRAARPHVDRPRMLQASRASGYTFRSTDVGVVLDLMIHDLDLVLSLVNQELIDVQAWGQAVVGPHEDVASARLVFADGTVAQLSASRVSLQAHRTWQIFCDQTHATLDLTASTAKLTRRSPRLAAEDFDPNQLPVPEKNHWRERFFTDLFPVEEVPVVPGNAIEEEQRDFLRAIRENGSPQVTGADALRTLIVAQQILDGIQASASNRTSHVPAATAPARTYRKTG